MKNYSIEIDYTHGDSFNSERSKLVLEESWNLETAKINIQRIKEHYQAYNNRNGFVSCMLKNHEDKLLEEIKSKPWYVSQDDIDYKCYYNPWESNVKLLDNNGSPYVYNTSTWMGCFEILHGARIVLIDDNEDDMEFHF